ncbi:hypothetical protein AVEN_96360-1 [Araneus ventricosus]|uniref:Uncharacterized protein n=1 Tax=Araneus ventricosus TaxID=182803 RepID=A0A4Y2TBZ2_ARAVE|nr:hypothetical protein AVEN_96360-1 [Araneus ventricosus]
MKYVKDLCSSGGYPVLLSILKTVRSTVYPVLPFILKNSLLGVCLSSAVIHFEDNCLECLSSLPFILKTVRSECFYPVLLAHFWKTVCSECLSSVAIHFQLHSARSVYPCCHSF